jgi:hypothetical protein
MTLLPTNDYKPYKPTARWRKWIDKHIEQPSTRQHQAYLYLQTDRIREKGTRRKVNKRDNIITTGQLEVEHCS